MRPPQAVPPGHAARLLGGRKPGGESGILVGNFSYLTEKERDCDKTFQRLHFRPFHTLDFFHGNHTGYLLFLFKWYGWYGWYGRVFPFVSGGSTATGCQRRWPRC